MAVNLKINGNVVSLGQVCPFPKHSRVDTGHEGMLVLTDAHAIQFRSQFTEEACRELSGITQRKVFWSIEDLIQSETHRADRTSFFLKHILEMQINAKKVVIKIACEPVVRHRPSCEETP